MDPSIFWGKMSQLFSFSFYGDLLHYLNNVKSIWDWEAFLLYNNPQASMNHDTTLYAFLLRWQNCLGIIQRKVSQHVIWCSLVAGIHAATTKYEWQEDYTTALIWHPNPIFKCGCYFLNKLTRYRGASSWTKIKGNWTAKLMLFC